VPVTVGDTLGQRRRGRRPKADKRVQLNVLVAPEVRERLVAMAAKTGRKLTHEVEHRLVRSLNEEEDRARSNVETRIDGLVDNIRNLVSQCFDDLADDFRAPMPLLVLHGESSAAGSESTAQPDKDLVASPEPVGEGQQHSDRAADRGWISGMLAEYGKHGDVARLLPAEISVGPGDDGGVMVTVRQDGRVREIPMPLQEALRIIGNAFEASGPSEKRAMLEVFGLSEEPAAIKPKRKSQRRSRGAGSR
jgi:hypothetical protein